MSRHDFRVMLLGVIVGGASVAVLGHAASTREREAVAALDTAFQAAVKINDAAAIDRILDSHMVLVLGNGKVQTREDQVKDAREQVIHYEHQEEDAGTQSVRVYGDTAVVTARLWIKGVSGGTAFDERLWFSDTYVRTPQGWKYAFGQASLPLPASAAD